MLKKRAIKNIYYRSTGYPVSLNLSEYYKELDTIKSYSFANRDSAYLKTRIQEIRHKIHSYKSTEQFRSEVFALTCEVAYRELGMRPYDLQIIAGLILNQGKLCEMKTGEGKTLAAIMPAILNSLKGGGVHIFTANDYLAQRDAEWMDPVYRFFDLSVHSVHEGMSIRERQEAYRGDIVYLTAKEAGFDFLRDQICRKPEDLVQRELNYCIIDEGDFILIDEARVPLVIAGETESAELDYQKISSFVKELLPKDYEIDDNRRNISLTESGIQKMESVLNSGSLFDKENQKLLTFINLTLQAIHLLSKDRDYIIRDGRIEIVDEFTGRVAEGRKWPDGLQTAIEAKEELCIQKEGRVLTSITIQHFVNNYSKIAAMTATAQSAAREFKTFYGLSTVVLPTTRKCIREDHPPHIFTDKQSRDLALIEEIVKIHGTKRPILVGTSSVKESEHIGAVLKKRNIPCRILNARNHSDEAEIVKSAGAPGSVTISTNMAGRGTDILLGGADGKEYEYVKALGGLYVIGTNIHESVRIDDQLRGRAGRQGDPGSSCFFISLEDDLISRYGLDKYIRKITGDTTPGLISSPLIRREILRLQRIVEGQNYEIRKTLESYSSFIEKQRQIIFSKRENFLCGNSATDIFRELSPDHYSELVSAVGENGVNQIERDLFIHFTDKFWSQHLANVADVKEGIHMRRLGGGNPLFEYIRETEALFLELEREIEEESLRVFNDISISDGKVSFNGAEIKGPNSTWTYLINDNPFTGLGIQMIASANIGSSAVAALALIYYLPLLPFIFLTKAFRKPKNNHPK